MAEVVEVELEWKYSPAGYIECSVSQAFEGGTLEMAEGIASVRLSPDVYHSNSAIEDVLTRRVRSMLQAVQLTRHSPFELNGPSRIDHRDDGTKNHFVRVDSMRMTMSVGFADIVVKDKDGHVVSDTRAERLSGDARLAELIEQHRNENLVVEAVLNSYATAVSDPDDELVHLYEVRDALSAALGGADGAMAALGVTKREWSDFGRVVNVEPISQGRHRGGSAGRLRPATESELAEVRAFAQKLIEKYLVYLGEDD